MSSWRLSKRLQAIADFIPDHTRIADIGGDHAFLLIHLAQEGRLAYGIVGEVNQGPYENALNNVQNAGVESQIDVRFGNGLSVIRPREVEFLVLSGMGGALITEILDKGKEKLGHMKGMILQPNIHTAGVRIWLEKHQWQLITETIIHDGDHLYEILVAKPGKNQELYQDEMIRKEILFEIGPLLWKHKHPLLAKRISEEIQRKKSMIKQLEKGKTHTAVEKRRIESDKIVELERVIKWLSKAMS